LHYSTSEMLHMAACPWIADTGKPFSGTKIEGISRQGVEIG
ncbi:hypothetical protein T01_10646, partial [Trichinella spiralis]